MIPRYHIVAVDVCEISLDKILSCGNKLYDKCIYVTVSGKTTLLAEIEKVGFLLSMDSINTRLCCSTSS